MRPFFVGIEKKLFGDNFMTQPVDKAYIAGVALGTSLTLLPGYAFADMGLNINGVNWYTPKPESSIENKVLNADGKKIIADTTTGTYAPEETAKWSTAQKAFWTIFGVAVVSGGAYLYSNNQHKKHNKRTIDSPNNNNTGGSNPPPSDPPPIGGDPPLSLRGGGEAGGVNTRGGRWG